mmetsp:Transcript_3783/g.4251  ORF Transcript_3783/g.4251 Transcript_3783/m.4251 type:complete len:422 (+) Transcript_3783:79-1344(+)
MGSGPENQRNNSEFFEELHSRVRASSFNPNERLLRANGSFRSSIRLKRNSSVTMFQEPKDLDVSAREHTSQFHLPSSDAAIVLTGGVKNQKIGLLSVRSSGPISWVKGWRKKFCLLEKGKMTFFSPKTVADEGIEDAEPEGEISLVDIRWIEYEKLGDDRFAIVLGSAGKKKLKKFRKSSGSIRNRSLGTGKSARAFASTRTNGSYSSVRSFESSRATGRVGGTQHEKGYRQSKIYFHSSNRSELEDWIRHLLVEMKNQALFVEKSAQVLKTTPEATPEAMEMLLRQTVDLWILAVGKLTPESAAAQERLAECLEADLLNNKSEEAMFWARSAEGIRQVLEEKRRMKEMEERDDTRRRAESLEFISTEHLDKLRKKQPRSGLEILQEETALNSHLGDFESGFVPSPPKSGDGTAVNINGML